MEEPNTKEAYGDMKQTLVVLTVILTMFICSTNAQQVIFQSPLSPRIASYKISVTLNAQKKKLSGTETLVWRNTSSNRIKELRFHLYLNAFKNSASTFMKELRGRRGSRYWKHEMGMD